MLERLATKKRRRMRKGEDFEIDPYADHPVHEKYTKMEEVKR